ncbi:hypothetical protein SB783_41930, partial [Paraburkholderia sp. SIMBA_009]
LQLAEQAGGKRTQRGIEGIDTAFSLQQTALHQGFGAVHALGNPLPMVLETIQQGFRPQTRSGTFEGTAFVERRHFKPATKTACSLIEAAARQGEKLVQ